MVSITLPDGNIKEYNSAVTGAQIAKDIAPSLLKKALVVEVDGEFKDLGIEISKDICSCFAASIVIVFLYHD